MKKFISLLFLCAVICTTKGLTQTKEDSASIRKAVLDYIEGWYDGDVARMDKALHPDLNKKQVFYFQQSSTDLVNQASKSMMLEYTRAGFGTKTPREKIKNDVIILDIYHNIATVKATSYDYVDYCHVVKYNGEWKIINVLWDRNFEKEE